MALEIPESVLKMVAGFLGIDRAKAEQFVNDFHEATSKVINNQDEIVATVRQLKADMAVMLSAMSAQMAASTLLVERAPDLPNGKDVTQ